MFDPDTSSAELTPGDILNVEDLESKDQLFNRLYSYLYGICQKNEVNRLINQHQQSGKTGTAKPLISLPECPGFCTNKWMEETVAIKCYDCEYDSTCAVCLDCFFNSDHTGHEYRLTRTSGGCCDCGDVSSWDVKGSCTVHNQSINYHERRMLAIFTSQFLSRLEELLRYLVNYVSGCLKDINVVSSESLQLVVLFMNDLVNSSPSYRYSLHLLLSNEVLKEWMLKHQILHNNLQKAFNSLYLTMLTSMSFKRKFSFLFVSVPASTAQASLYVDIVQPLKEIPDEWHLSNLSVQLFTYSNIAYELVTRSFLKSCIDPLMDESSLDKRLSTLQFPRFDRKKFSLYIRIISDFTYLMNHNAVCSLLLSDATLQELVFSLFAFHNHMNLIERESRSHVTFENSGYSITFTIEHSLHNAFKPFSDFIKTIEDSRLEELARFYRSYNDFVRRRALGVCFDTEKLARSFHIPLVRLFSYIVDFNLVRRSVKAELARAASADSRASQYLLRNFPDLVSADGPAARILEAFDSDVLEYLLTESLNVLKFAAEVKQNLWVYNGESMHDQRSNYYELLFHTFDIASIQSAVVLLGTKGLGAKRGVLSLIFDLCLDVDSLAGVEFTANSTKIPDQPNEDDSEDVSIMEINDVVDKLFNADSDPDLGMEEDENLEQNCEDIGNASSPPVDCVMELAEEGGGDASDPGDLEFKLNFLFGVLNTLACDVKHLEIMSVSKKTTKEAFVRRGYPLLKMDIVNALSSGNAEFGQVVNETKKHWKHHPRLIETIEEVAMFNYSKVSDKTYIRLKPDALSSIDVLWNPHQPITHHISKEALNHGVSLIGDAGRGAMSAEYEETQNLILNSISCCTLFQSIALLLSSFCKIATTRDPTSLDASLKSSFQSLPDLLSPGRDWPRVERLRNAVTSRKFEFSSCSLATLCALKMLNLLLTKMQKPEERVAEFVLDALESMLKCMDDEIYKRSTSYTIKRISALYSFASRAGALGALQPAKDVRSIQRQFMQRLVTQNTAFSKQLEEVEMGPESEQMQCVLCKQVVDDLSSMSIMAFISTNNVLRRCVATAGGAGHRVNAMSAFPLKSSIITSCGHMAHTTCVNKHRMAQSDKQLFTMYGIQRLPSEFFCPLCKSLCNYTLTIFYTPVMDTCLSHKTIQEFIVRMKNAIKFTPEYFKELFGCEVESVQDDIMDEDDVPQFFAEMNKLTVCSWRYPYSASWVPSPVYAKNEQFPRIMYAIEALAAPSKSCYYASPAGDGFEELAPTSAAPAPDLECSCCSKMELEALDLEAFSCPAFRDHESPLLPPSAQPDPKRTRRIDALLEHVTSCWELYRDTDFFAALASQMPKLDLAEPFPAALASPYAKALFGSRRTYFGVQNWRHVNSTVMVEPKFWLLYNEILSVSAWRRNTLTLPNSIYSQLLRNFYIFGMKYDTHYLSESLDGVLEHNVILDDTYHDMLDESPLVPELGWQGGAELRRATSVLRLALEALPDATLEELCTHLKLSVSKKGPTTAESEAAARVRGFFHRVQKSRHSASAVRSLKPLKHYLYAEGGRCDVHKLFANDLTLNPWSCDFVREFLLDTLSGSSKKLNEVLLRLYYYLLVAALQVMDRFFMDRVQESYARFVDANAPLNPTLMRSRVKREFLLAYVDRFFTEFFDNAEFPCDVRSRLMLTDFHKNLAAFRAHNCNGAAPGGHADRGAAHVWPRKLRKKYSAFNAMMQELITYASMLRSVHDEHVEAFTEPVPSVCSRLEAGSPVIDDSALDEYLVRQVSRILRVRELHNSLDLKLDEAELVRSLSETRSASPLSKRQRMVDRAPGHESCSQSIFVRSGGDKPLAAKSARMYRGPDLARRINKLLRRSHCSAPFFEALRHHVPDSIHTLDFIDADFAKAIDWQFVPESGAFFGTVQAVFKHQAAYFRSRGYLGPECALRFSDFKRALFESLNLFLDVAFWTINCICKFDDELCSRITYSNLYDPEKRFLTLLEALRVESVADDEFCLDVLRRMFSSTCKAQMTLNRLCNMEVTPPIVSAYRLLDIDRHLPQLNWEAIRSAAFRSCANCGLRPANPLLCLLCGALLCSNNECCHRPRLSADAKLIAQLEGMGVGFKKADVAWAFEEEMLAHAKACGGGQAVFLSPYHCCVLLVDDRRRCVIPSVYSDKYGNSDLHGKVYGAVELSRVRLDNIASTYCSGRLANEIVSHRKQLFTYFI